MSTDEDRHGPWDKSAQRFEDGCREDRPHPGEGQAKPVCTICGSAEGHDEAAHAAFVQLQAEARRGDRSLAQDLATVLNRHSAENASGTPDFILGEMLTLQLAAFDQAVLARADWRGEPTELPALVRPVDAFDPVDIAREAVERGRDPLAVVVGVYGGYLSGCWEDLSGAGVFESTRARDATDRTVAWLQAQLPAPFA